ncbi:MAG: hypothetical protein IPO78_17765 [Saprospiraceae bacterium]|nr:hypothetical protein [Saprospiraceae bacterium]
MKKNKKEVKYLNNEFDLIVSCLGEFYEYEERKVVISEAYGGDEHKFDCSKREDLRKLYVYQGCQSYSFHEFEDRINDFMQVFIDNHILSESISRIIHNEIALEQRII